MNTAPPAAALVATLWLVVGCANLVLLSLGPFSAGQMAKVLSTTACGLALSLVLSFATGRLTRRPGAFRGAILFGLALCGGLCAWAFDATMQAQDFASGAPHLPSPGVFVSLRLNLVYYCLIFVLQASALALLAFRNTVQARERQLGEVRLAAQQARLAALRYQINPHFLFNTLNAISTLVGESRGADAEEMIARLAGFLRTTLETEWGEICTLEQELETVQAYLDIEAIRFGERLDLRFDCEDGLSDALVPTLILQPLVENAVKHAVAPAQGRVVVSVMAERRGACLCLSVQDTGTAHHRTPPAGAGVGLSNVAARLETQYGGRATLQAAAQPGGFRAAISLPYTRADPDLAR